MGLTLTIVGVVDHAQTTLELVETNLVAAPLNVNDQVELALHSTERLMLKLNDQLSVADISTER